MPSFIQKSLISLALIGIYGTTGAGEIILSDQMNWNEVTISSTSALDWWHELDDYAPSEGMIITSALLTVDLIDSSNKGNEDFTFVIGNSAPYQSAGFKNINNGSQGDSYNIEITGQALEDLNTFGKLHVSLTAESGSFQLVSSTLTAIDPPSAVPEPGSVGLLGLGLAGLGVIRRRKSAG